MAVRPPVEPRVREPFNLTPCGAHLMMGPGVPAPSARRPTAASAVVQLPAELTVFAGTNAPSARHVVPGVLQTRVLRASLSLAGMHIISRLAAWPRVRLPAIRAAFAPRLSGVGCRVEGHGYS